MGDNIKSLRKENSELLKQIQNLSQEFEQLKSKMASSMVDTNLNEVSKSIQFLSNEYDVFMSFKGQAEEKLNNMMSSLALVEKKALALSQAIEAIHRYNYQYNIKITGIPQTNAYESAEETTKICLKLFKKIGAEELTANDIDISHRIPNRHRSTKPPVIICKFVRRLAKERVMKYRKRSANITNVDLGFPSTITVHKISMFDHLTPMMQDLFQKCKVFQKDNGYRFCWTRNSSIFIRRTEDDQAHCIRSAEDLDYL